MQTRSDAAETISKGAGDNVQRNTTLTAGEGYEPEALVEAEWPLSNDATHGTGPSPGGVTTGTRIDRVGGLRHRLGLGGGSGKEEGDE